MRGYFVPAVNESVPSIYLALDSPKRGSRAALSWGPNPHSVPIWEMIAVIRSGSIVEKPHFIVLKPLAC